MDIIKAVRFSNINYVRDYFNSYPLSINDVNVFNDTILHIAIKYQNFDIVNYLLTIPNIDVNILNIDGATPLMLAFTNKNINIISALIDYPLINPYMINNYGRSIYHIIFDPDIMELNSSQEFQDYHKFQTINYFLNKFPIDNIINNMDNSMNNVLLISISNFTLFKYIISFPEVNIHHDYPGKNNILHKAAKNGHEDVIMYLVNDMSFDINEKNSDNLSPINIICINNRLNILHDLLLLNKNKQNINNLLYSVKEKNIINCLIMYKRDREIYLKNILKERDIQRSNASNFYILYLLYNDNYLIIRDINNKLIKFFNICSKLNVDCLQILFLRLYYSTKNIIPISYLCLSYKYFFNKSI